LPAFSRKEYTDLYIYCTNEFIYSAKATKLTIKSALGRLVGTMKETKRNTARKNTALAAI
jgi:hypothetical protein